MNIVELLTFVVKNSASDLHLSAGMPPMIRVHGEIRRINLPEMGHKEVHAMVYDIMNDSQRKFYEEHLECDFPLQFPISHVSASMHLIRSVVPQQLCERFHQEF